MQPHHVEIGTVDDAGTNDARLADADHRERNRGELPERAHRLHAAAEVGDLRHRERHVLDAVAGGALLDVNEAALVAVHERPEQHAAHEAEHRGICADPERERQDDGGRQAFGPRERAEGELEILEKSHLLYLLHVGAVIVYGIVQGGQGPPPDRPVESVAASWPPAMRLRGAPAESSRSKRSDTIDHGVVQWRHSGDSGTGYRVSSAQGWR